LLYGENPKEIISKLIDQSVCIGDTDDEQNRVVKLKDGIVGIPHITGNYPAQLQEIRERPLEDEDVLVCSYPKTGRFPECASV